MIRIRPSAARGHFDFGWLDTFHSFSFGDYRDPEHMGFRTLRVINEDRIQAGQGFGVHPHRDMEILTWVLEGTLQHKDSLGSGGVIRPGELQRMSAGTGLTHSEFNASQTEPVHLLQIWILPEAKGLQPRYGQTAFPAERRRNRLQLLASHSGREGSLDIHQDADLWVADLDSGVTLDHTLAPGRSAWIQVARGRVTVNGTALEAGDGAAVTGESLLNIAAVAASQILLFDLG
jgi:redox-sensitive bicupin YhaK (pirin superfamily)